MHLLLLRAGRDMRTVVFGLVALAASACVTTASDDVPITPTVAPAPTPVASKPTTPPTFDAMADLSTMAACKPKKKRAANAKLPPTTPSNFSDMSTCHPAIPTFPASATKAPGLSNNDGDCVFANGVVCHYHDGGNEFGRRGAAQGEVHCIFPTSIAEHPFVVGFQYKCHAGTKIHSPHAEASPTNPTNACGAGLSDLLSACKDDSHCCKDGHLTKDWSKQSAAERAVRPAFAICPAVQTINCNDDGPLGGMHGHTTNDGMRIL